MTKKPIFVTDEHEREWNKKEHYTHVIRYDEETSRSFVTKIDKETGEEHFDQWDQWRPADFRQLIKEKYNIDVK